MLNSFLYASDRRPMAALTGAAVGLFAGLLGLLVVLLGPTMAFGTVLGLAAGLYVLTDLYGGLYVTIAVIALIPFGNVPFNISPTPTLLDGAMGGFLAVYLMQWMSGQRRLFQTTPVTPIAIGFTGLMLFAYLMGLRHAMLDQRTLRTVIEMVIGLMLIPVLIDVMRDEIMLRRAVLVLILMGSLSALAGIILWVMPDFTAEAVLNRLGRFGYPVGGVLRYRADYTSVLNERAIGTWVDPNGFGGFLLMVGAVTAPQVFARKPVLPRWLIAGCLGVIVLALFLTDSRGSMLSLGAAFGFVAVLRYRRLLPIMALAVVLALLLPQTQRYVNKIEAGLRGEDVETQMRFGEYKDALTLVQRYPVIGVGFSGTPEIDLYLGVANTYLTIASHAGLVGLAGYLLLMGSPFVYSARHYKQIRANPAISDVWLGLAAGLIGVLCGGVFDHFYFKIDLFQATMTLVWIIMG
ncbi:MAG: O-antigen ligase family protein, partial [Chloroflexi bacterium]|nr:O-antigen ligase family protein [Chloroflexota bacterium]